MKKVLFLLLGIVIQTTACKTNTELTDADKDAIVQAVKQTSKEFLSDFSSTYDSETYAKVMAFYDENADNIWQTEPVAAAVNTDLINTQKGLQNIIKSIIDTRTSTPFKVLESYYSVLSEDIVLEVIKFEADILMRDSTVVPTNFGVNTTIWANINGEWKIQYFHQSGGPKSE